MGATWEIKKDKEGCLRAIAAVVSRQSIGRHMTGRTLPAD
jgi:hypothetical protein